jgi:hypothetical protein
VTAFSGGGGEFQIEERRVAIGIPRTWWSCKHCGRLTANDLSGRCFIPGCGGALAPLSGADLEERQRHNHYAQRLRNAEPFGLEVKEHTAQLSNTAGKQYQDLFNQGLVNVLSTSTTFEMGVDVAGLEAVLLRNVPPTPANYVQRAGRAGRRRSGGAVAVTFCRPLPHDQVHFHDPLKAVAGIVPLPRINLANVRLLQRHVNSFLLGSFLHSLAPKEDWRTVGAFFCGKDGVPPLMPKFDIFIRSHLRRLAKAVREVIPAKENTLTGNEAITVARESLVGDAGINQREVQDQLSEFSRQGAQLREQMLHAAHVTPLAQAIDGISLLKRALLERDLIGFLADAHWLPSYAFPQDNVRLLVRHPRFTRRMRLERDREIGISEYAPGAEVIADGLLFRSCGVVKRGNVFRVRHYRYCKNCRQLDISDTAIGPLCRCGGGRSRTFIEPVGFQTLASELPRRPNLFRKRTAPNTELFLVGGASPEAFAAHGTVPGVSHAYLLEGRLFRANQGPKAAQYRLCLDCGVVPDGPPAQHKTPWGTRCGGALTALDLGHEFDTETLQVRFDGAKWRMPDVSDRTFWCSFSTGFLSTAAGVLNTPERDMGVTYRSESADSLTGELVLYDRVPGGAGYVQRIITDLAIILRALLARTRDCSNPECDPQGSCYSCLRSYSNQFDWLDLKRQAVVDVLEPALSRVRL